MDRPVTELRPTDIQGQGASQITKGHDSNLLPCQHTTLTVQREITTSRPGVKCSRSTPSDKPRYAT